MCITYNRLKCHFHRGPVSHESRSQDTCVTSIHVPIPISPPIEVLRVASNLHPNHISTMPGLRDVHLTSIYVHSHCHRSPLIGISSPSRSRFTCILVESHLNLSHDNYISDTPRSNYTPIQVSRHLCLTAIHPSPPPPHPTHPTHTYTHPHTHPPTHTLSTQSRPPDSRLTFIQIESHPNPGPHNCI